METVGILIISFLLTWTTILLPPILLRWLQKRPLSRTAATITAAALFILNHVIFLALVGPGPRTVLLLGGILSWLILRRGNTDRSLREWLRDRGEERERRLQTLMDADRKGQAEQDR